MAHDKDGHGEQPDNLNAEQPGTSTTDEPLRGESYTLKWRPGDPPSVRLRRLADSDGDRSGHRLRACFQQAVRVLGLAAAQTLFERTEADQLCKRADAFKSLSASYADPTSGRLCTTTELAARIEALVGELEANRGPLIRDGLPATKPSMNWPAGPLVNVYPIDSAWLTTWPDRQEFDRLRTEELRHDFISVPYRWLSPADVARLQAGRTKFLDLKISVLRQLSSALRTGDWASLWPESVRLFSDALSAGDVNFYRVIDLHVGGLFPLGNPAGVESDGSTFLGGLTALLQFIGHCEEELRIGAMDWAARHICVAQNVAPFKSYFETVSQPLRADLDATLDRLADLHEQSSRFWHEYEDRVHYMLLHEFEEEVVTLTRFKPTASRIGQPSTREVAKSEESHSEMRGGLPPIHATSETVPASTSTNSFKREGEYWTIIFQAGKPLRLQATLGLAYIALLLRTPGREHLPRDLIAEVNPPAQLPSRSPYGRMSREQWADDGLTVGGLIDDGGTPDEQGRRDLHSTRAALQQDLYEAERNNDIGRSSALREKIEWIEHYLAGALGLAGRPRRTSDPTEKARKSVSNAIDRSLDRIKAQNPALSQHLLRAIKKGDLFSYSPSQPIEWDL